MLGYRFDCKFAVKDRHLWFHVDNQGMQSLGCVFYCILLYDVIYTLNQYFAIKKIKVLRENQLFSL